MTISDTDFERLSAALDGRLDLSARQQFDADLAASAELQAAWQDLQTTVNMLRELPPIVPTRSFSLDPALYGPTRRSWFGQMRWLGAVGMLLILVVAAGSFWAGQSGDAADQSNTAALEAPATAAMAAQMDSAGGADPANYQRTLPAPENDPLPNAGSAASEGATMEPTMETMADATAEPADALAAAPLSTQKPGALPMTPPLGATGAAATIDPVLPPPAGSADAGTEYHTMTITSSDMFSATRMVSELPALAADDGELGAAYKIDLIPEPEPNNMLGTLAGILTGALVLVLLVGGLWWRSRR